MKRSTYPLELDLGMDYYASDTGGIGGSLRTIPEDFRVDEIPVEGKGGTSGPYLICQLEKTNWELQHAVKELAKRLGISHRRIGWAGTKDRNAITSQRISLYNVTPDQVNAVRMKDITLKVIGQSNTPLVLGDLLGNRFAIVIRDVSAPDLPGSVDEVTEAVTLGVPNYYGIQRFGAIRPVTHRVGEWILKGNYEESVLTYIGMEFPGEPDEIKQIRAVYRDTRDAGAALHGLPVQMNYERAMLHHLYSHPDDYAGALQELPPKLLSMFVSAFQSYLFNRALSHRIEEGNTLIDPVAGDTLLFANGRMDTATTANLTAAAMHIRRERCSIALFMPGRSVHDGSVDPAMMEMLERSGITPADFDRASSFVGTKFEGAYRPVALKTKVKAVVDDSTVRLDFELPPGHYATTVCREYMKADPVRMV